MANGTHLKARIAACAIAALIVKTDAAQAASNISDPAYTVINTRTSQNRSQFFVYKDVDSPFNHGFPSGRFGEICNPGCVPSPVVMAKLHVNPSCVYSASAPDGCSTDPTAFDKTPRGTVFQFTFDPVASGEFVGLNFEEPENWGANRNGIGYDLTGATQLVFDAISPTGGIQVQFSVNGSTTAYMSIPQQWSTITINLNSLGLTSLTGVHLLFGIASNDMNASRGGTVLLDNIHFLPVPTSQTTALGLPLANQVFGIEHVQNSLPGSIPIPPDQINSNLATLYESSLAIIALINRGQPQDLTNAKLIADTLVYALGHDNQGDQLPASVNAAGLHNGMFAGDIALSNSQAAQGGQQGQVRLAGFTASVLCPQTGFCLVLDGATGGNAAIGILGLLAAYKQFQNSSYLNAALTVSNWIYDNLRDQSGSAYGGYFAGYPDMGCPKILQTGKSTENNADIFAAFTALASAENAAGNTSAATLWTTRANAAGDFVMRMYESGTGHFFAGTVPRQSTGAGPCPTSSPEGDEVINTFDFLDAQTFPTLAMAPTPRYRNWNQIDWHLPVQWVVNHFQRSVTAGNVTFHGFDLIEASEHLPTDGPAGIAWEFTGQEVAAMKLVDTLYGTSQFVSLADTYLNQIRQAQTAAPFTDSLGVVASTLQNGDTVASYNQCLVTPYQCIPERVGLAATIWGIAAEQGLDPFLSSVQITAVAVEYYYSAWNFYFMTAFPAEIAALDGGAFGGAWQRTGQTFNVWPQPNAMSTPTCRFFSIAFAPKSSHFYTPFPAECLYVETNPADVAAWEFENIAFYIRLADGSGLCDGGTTPLYRLYNNGMGGAPNHRYTTSLAILNQMIAAGWVFEGNGNTGVFACVPQ